MLVVLDTLRREGMQTRKKPPPCVAGRVALALGRFHVFCIGVLVLQTASPVYAQEVFVDAAWLSPRQDFASFEEPSTFLDTGASQGWNADDAVWQVELPFSFPFYGPTYDVCYVDSNGRVLFSASASDFTPSMGEFKAAAMIAALWNDLTTTESNHDIFLESGPEYVLIRWEARYLDENSRVNVSVKLEVDGAITMQYGSGNSLGGLIGLSGGPEHGCIVSEDSLSGSMDNADDLRFEPTTMATTLDVLGVGETDVFDIQSILDLITQEWETVLRVVGGHGYSYGAGQGFSHELEFGYGYAYGYSYGYGYGFFIKTPMTKWTTNLPGDDTPGTFYRIQQQR
jgi:hypothetical protein